MQKGNMNACLTVPKMQKQEKWAWAASQGALVLGL
jgi:hypothetical protein